MPILQYRRAVFITNSEQVGTLNVAADGDEYSVDMSPFADLTPSEFRRKVTLPDPPLMLLIPSLPINH